MFKALSFAIAATAAVVSSNASAQTASDFTGLKAEAVVGLDQLRFDLADVGGSGRQHRSDLGYGGAIGYDVALTPMLVGGVEVDALGSDTSYMRGGTTNGGSLRQRREVDVVGRLGVPITPNALVYGTVGYSNLQVRETRIVSAAATDTIRDLDGVSLGAGLQVNLNSKAYVKSEYRYTNYADGFDGNKVLTGIGFRF